MERTEVLDVARVVVAGTDTEECERLARGLADAGHVAQVASDAGRLADRIRLEPCDLVLLDLDLPPSGGLTALEGIKKARPQTLVIMTAIHPAIEAVVSAFRKGAHDFLRRPLDLAILHDGVTRAVSLRHMGEQRRRLAEDLENERLRVLDLQRQLGASDPFVDVLGTSGVMRGIVEIAREVARTDSTVLITGESGTGKGLLARAIHRASVRAAGPFVEANCVVYSEGLLHSELFGHEKGAFTGAGRLKRGRFEMARAGTLFLDEIGEITAATQLLLLRVLQDRTFERVGGEETIEADVRLVAATNRDLLEAMRRGDLRSDLYYRLNVIPIHLPPLREHAEDVLVLAHRFLDRCSARLGRPVRTLAPEVMDALLRHPWPGNARELENLIERLVVLAHSDRIEMEDLPPAMRRRSIDPRETEGTLLDLERRRILEVLHDTGGNKKAAAARLGIHRSSLYAKLHRHGLALGEPARAGGGRDSGQRMSEDETAARISNSSRR